MKMKHLKIKLKGKFMLFLFVITFVFSVPFLSIACSSSNTWSNNKVTEHEINNQYKLFAKAKILDFAIDNLYQENFDWSKKNSENGIELSLDQVSKFLDFNSDFSFLHQNLDEKFIIKMINIDNKNKLELRYEIWDKNNNVKLEPTQSDLDSSIVVSELKTFNESESKFFQYVYKKFQENNWEIKQGTAVLSSDKYKDILPTYLNDENFKDSLESFNVSIKTLLDQQQDWKTNIMFEAKDIDGIIEIKLEILNTKNDLNMEFYPVNSSEQKIKKVSGFAKFDEKNKEIIDIYSTLGKPYNLFELNGNKEFIQLASSIYDIETLGITLNNVSKLPNVPDKNFVLPDFFDKDKKDNLWYELKVNINASDNGGILNAEFIIVDKFTKTEISPPNITKIMTITRFISLVEQSSENTNETNYLVINNVYKAYELFENIQLKNNIYGILPSESADYINVNWLKTNTENKLKWNNTQTDIFEVESNPSEINLNRKIKPNEKFEIITNYFKVKKIDTNTQINDNVNGIKNIPILLQIGLTKNGKVPETNVQLSELTFIDVLPPISRTISENQVSFNSRTAKIKYLKIGKYRNEDIDIANKIYNRVKEISNKKWVFEVSNKSFFELLNKKQSELPELLKEKIDDKVKDILLEIFKLEVESEEKVNSIINTFHFNIDLPNETMEAEFDTTNNSNKPILLKTKESFLKIISKKNDTAIENYNQSTKEEFPKVIIKIKMQ